MSMNDTHQQGGLRYNTPSALVAVSVGVTAATVVVFGKRLVRPSELSRKRWRMIGKATVHKVLSEVLFD